MGTLPTKRVSLQCRSEENNLTTVFTVSHLMPIFEDPKHNQMPLQMKITLTFESLMGIGD